MLLMKGGVREEHGALPEASGAWRSAAPSGPAADGVATAQPVEELFHRAVHVQAVHSGQRLIATLSGAGDHLGSQR